MFKMKFVYARYHGHVFKTSRSVGIITPTNLKAECTRVLGVSKKWFGPWLKRLTHFKLTDELINSTPQITNLVCL